MWYFNDRQAQRAHLGSDITEGSCRLKLLLPNPQLHSGRHVRWWWLLGCAGHSSGVIIRRQKHRGVIAGNINQDVRGIPAIDVSVAAPNTAYQVTLKCQNNADKQKNNKNQTRRIHRHYIVSVGKVGRQLSYVLLNGVRIDKHGDRNQGVQSKIEDLVTEEWDDPGSVLLVRAVRGHRTYQDHEQRDGNSDAHISIIHELKFPSEFRARKVILIRICQGAQQDQQDHGIDDQVPDAQQDGAGADMAAQAAAVRVEPRPGRDHLHRSDARTSLRERRPRRSRLR